MQVTLAPPGSTRKGSAAEKALQHIGTNAIPYLLRWVEAEKPHWTDRFRQKATSVLQPLGITIQPRDRLGPMPLGLAFGSLGRQADGAIPALSHIIQTSTSQEVATAAAGSLALLGDKGLLPLLAGITNRMTPRRSACIQAASLLGSNVVPIMPYLIESLKAPDPEVAQATARTFRFLSEFPDLVVAALAGALSHQDASVRCSAARALSELGRSAQPAEGALRAALSDPDPYVQQWAKSALITVAPEYLTNAPPK